MVGMALSIVLSSTFDQTLMILLYDYRKVEFADSNSEKLNCFKYSKVPYFSPHDVTTFH